MAKLNKLNPLAATVGAAVVASAFAAPAAQATQNPFASADLQSGYQLASTEMHAKSTEAKCGADKAKEEKKAEGNCGADKKPAEGSGGGDKMKAEGSCGGKK
ncbi:MAG: hypothetical protein R3292_04995 [Alcanivorax sp.]|nr:hypothetical protein [Alcanivorax sp.]